MDRSNNEGCVDGKPSNTPLVEQARQTHAPRYLMALSLFQKGLTKTPHVLFHRSGSTSMLTVASSFAPSLKEGLSEKGGAEGEMIRFDSSLPPDIQSMAELAQHLSGRTLDWNSCALVDGAILDGWGRVVTFASLDDGGFQLHSSGADGIFGTDDDIITEVQPPESTSPEEPTG